MDCPQKAKHLTPFPNPYDEESPSVGIANLAHECFVEFLGIAEQRILVAESIPNELRLEIMGECAIVRNHLEFLSLGPGRLIAGPQPGGNDIATLRIQQIKTTFREAHELFGEKLLRFSGKVQVRAQRQPDPAEIMAELRNVLNTLAATHKSNGRKRNRSPEEWEDLYEQFQSEKNDDPNLKESKFAESKDIDRTTLLKGFQRVENAREEAAKRRKELDRRRSD